MDDTERDRRSGPQWLRSILDYLEFRAGTNWRRLENPSERWSENRLYYLNGIRAINSLKVASSPTPHLVSSVAADELRADRLLIYGRPELVRRLLELRDDLSDRRLLSRFGRLKLARMIVAAENSLAEKVRAIA